MICINESDGKCQINNDQINEWSAEDKKLFEEGLTKEGLNFGLIQRNFLKSKSIKEVWQYYQYYKTLSECVNDESQCQVNDISEPVIYDIVDNKPVSFFSSKMETWSTGDVKLLEKGLKKFGKHFEVIRKDYLPTKSVKEMVEFYYNSKTTLQFVSDLTKKRQKRNRENRVIL